MLVSSETTIRLNELGVDLSDLFDGMSEQVTKKRDRNGAEYVQVTSDGLTYRIYERKSGSHKPDVIAVLHNSTT